MTPVLTPDAFLNGFLWARATRVQKGLIQASVSSRPAPLIEDMVRRAVACGFDATVNEADEATDEAGHLVISIHLGDHDLSGLPDSLAARRVSRERSNTFIEGFLAGRLIHNQAGTSCSWNRGAPDLPELLQALGADLRPGQTGSVFIRNARELSALVPFFRFLDEETNAFEPERAVPLPATAMSIPWEEADPTLRQAYMTICGHLAHQGPRLVEHVEGIPNLAAAPGTKGNLVRDSLRLVDLPEGVPRLREEVPHLVAAPRRAAPKAILFLEPMHGPYVRLAAYLHATLKPGMAADATTWASISKRLPTGIDGETLRSLVARSEPSVVLDAAMMEDAKRSPESLAQIARDAVIAALGGFGVVADRQVSFPPREVHLDFVEAVRWAAYQAGFRGPITRRPVGSGIRIAGLYPLTPELATAIAQFAGSPRRPDEALPPTWLDAITRTMPRVRRNRRVIPRALRQAQRGADAKSIGRGAE